MTSINRYLHVACWIALAVLASLLLINTWTTPDIWAHLYRGKQILETGQIPPPVNIVLQYDPPVFYWLYHVLSWILYSIGGIPLVCLSYLTLWLVIFIFLVIKNNFFQLRESGLIIVLISIFVCEIRFSPRPDISHYFRSRNVFFPF